MSSLECFSPDGYLHNVPGVLRQVSVGRMHVLAR